MDDKAKRIERAMKLALLATRNPSVEESRTAAVAFASFVLEHKLLEPPVVDSVEVWELKRRNEGLVREIARLDAEVKALRAIKIPPDLNPFMPPPSPSWREICSKFPSSCRSCGERISEGERVFWKRGAGTRRISCGPGDAT